MFHMLSCFNLKLGEDMDAFRSAYVDFVDYMKSIDLVEDSGAIGRRQPDTPMDTDNERQHEYFVIMSFRNQTQVDAAYAYIKKHVEPGESSHNDVYKKVQDPIFICWQDLL
ncbi:MAG: hypothetical protein HOL66_00920 [Rhodospirillaceae bacterium]|jgi:hypothetical protein|nr:hypothetical protein [Rhodospirillaceae bacterium]MBT5563987.1 hypothetical protein [Rhodospirillaceae bacterium]